MFLNQSQSRITELYQPPRQCSYIPELEATFRYFHISRCSEELYLDLLVRGWRRFGNYFFVPQCVGCDKCLSVRQRVFEFELSKGYRRILKKNSKTKIIIQHPTVTVEHLRIYDDFHRIMQQKKGWEYTPITPEIYYEMFVEGHLNFGYEFLYFIEEKLVCVALVDIIPSAISAVYCFYDHNYQSFSLGTHSILKQLELAKKLKIPYFYPGYWINNHHSMGYKDKFTPFEVLLNRPDIHEEPIWSL